MRRLVAEREVVAIILVGSHFTHTVEVGAPPHGEIPIFEIGEMLYDNPELQAETIRSQLGRVDYQTLSASGVNQFVLDR